jgi:hypothetical protein
MGRGGQLARLVIPFGTLWEVATHPSSLSLHRADGELEGIRTMPAVAVVHHTGWFTKSNVLKLALLQAVTWHINSACATAAVLVQLFLFGSATDPVWQACVLCAVLKIWVGTSTLNKVQSNISITACCDR